MLSSLTSNGSMKPDVVNTLQFLFTINKDAPSSCHDSKAQSTVNPGYNEPFCTLANGSLYPGIRCKGHNFTRIRQGGAHCEGSLYPGVRCIQGSLYASLEGELVMLLSKKEYQDGINTREMLAEKGKQLSIGRPAVKFFSKI